MVMRRWACSASLLVQALSASTSKDRNIAEVWDLGQGYSGAGGAVFAGMTGMLASALLSSIDRRLFYAVIGQFPLRKQRAVGAVRDQHIQGLRDRLLKRLLFHIQSKPGELDGENVADRDIGAGVEVHHVGQCLAALDSRVEPSLLELGPGIGRSFRADELNRVTAAIRIAPGADQLRKGSAPAGAHLFPAKRHRVLELRGAGLLGEEARPIAKVVNKGRRILPARHISHAGQDRIHPPRRDRGHHLVEAGFLPDDLDAELAAQRLAELDVETRQRVGSGIAEFHRWIVRHDGGPDAALLCEFRRQFDSRGRTSGGAEERGGKKTLHHKTRLIRSPRKERIECALRGERREPPPRARIPRSRLGPYKRRYPLPRAQSRARGSPPSSSFRCGQAPS